MESERWGVPDRYRYRIGEVPADDHTRRARSLVLIHLDIFRSDSFEEVRDEAPRANPCIVRMTPGNLPEKGLLFTGNVGTGKSTWLGVLATELRAKGIRIAWASWPDLVDQLGQAPQHRDVIEHLAGVQALFVDEMGQGGAPDFIRTRLLSLFGKRYDSKRPIYAATNLAGEELERSLGKALVSRLNETAESQEILGPDRRGVDGPRPRREESVRSEEHPDEKVGPDDPYVAELLGLMKSRFKSEIGRADFDRKVLERARKEGVADEEIERLAGAGEIARGGLA